MKTSGLTAAVSVMTAGLLLMSACGPGAPAPSSQPPSQTQGSQSGSTAAAETSPTETETRPADTTITVTTGTAASRPPAGTGQTGGPTRYVTEPGRWSRDAKGRMTVENLPAYSFDEDRYFGKPMKGGITVRKEPYVRGIGADMSHKTEGYNLSAETQAKDAANLQMLHVNALRTWGFYATNDVYESSFRNQGRTRSVTWQFNSFFPRSQNTKGEATVGWRYSLLDSVKPRIREEAAKLADLSFYDGIDVFLLANEPSNYQNGGGGFDPDTLAAYRKWLESRFGSILRLNGLAGTRYASFGDVYKDPAKEKSNKLLSYEHYLYLRHSYEQAVKFTAEAIGQVNPGLPLGMAGFDQGYDPYSAYARIADYLNTGATNIYAVHRPNLAMYAFDVDRYLAMYAGKPFFVTETGWPLDVTKKNPFSDANTLGAARKIKQIKALLYMRPQIQGSYWFNYGYKVEQGKNYWSIVDEDRNPIQTTHALSQVYNDFDYLDQFFVGGSSSPVVAITDQQVDYLRYNKRDIDYLMTALYAKGITAQVVTMSDDRDLSELELNKLILADEHLYQNPDGSEDVAAALVNYLKKPGTSVMSLTDKLPATLYGAGSGLGASSAAELHSRYPGYQYRDVGEDGAYRDLWRELAPFIHGDFAAGKVQAEKGRVDQNAVRILDTFAQADGFYDPAFQVQQQLVYKDGHVYLCIVNTGDKAIQDFQVTIGVNRGVRCNLHPTVLAADGNVTVSRPQRALIPSWLEGADSQIAYGTVTLQNLSTYAFIDLGMAAVE